MFYYISGTVVHKGDGFAVIDAGGIGYKLNASGATLEKIGDAGSFAKLYVYSNFKASSDTFDLYGFYDLEEKKLFEMIIGVSRVGAKTAITLLSNISPSKFALCVITNDFKYIASKTPGLGAKATDEAFYGQFAGQPADGQLQVIKNGTPADGEILSIAGATITSRGITDAVNVAVQCYLAHVAA